jgi:hypothetical protein
MVLKAELYGQHSDSYFPSCPGGRGQWDESSVDLLGRYASWSGSMVSGMMVFIITDVSASGR